MIVQIEAGDTFRSKAVYVSDERSIRRMPSADCQCQSPIPKCWQCDMHVLFSLSLGQSQRRFLARTVVDANSHASHDKAWLHLLPLYSFRLLEISALDLHVTISYQLD